MYVFIDRPLPILFKPGHLRGRIQGECLPYAIAKHYHQHLGMLTPADVGSIPGIEEVAGAVKGPARKVTNLGRCLVSLGDVKERAKQEC